MTCASGTRSTESGSDIVNLKAVAVTVRCMQAIYLQIRTSKSCTSPPTGTCHFLVVMHKSFFAVARTTQRHRLDDHPTSPCGCRATRHGFSRDNAMRNYSHISGKLCRSSAKSCNNPASYPESSFGVPTGRYHAKILKSPKWQSL